jgi:hypothetical protein
VEGHADKMMEMISSWPNEKKNQKSKIKKNDTKQKAKQKISLITTWNLCLKKFDVAFVILFMIVVGY